MSAVLSEAKLIRVLLAISDELLGYGLKAALEQESDIQVVGVARTAASAFAVAGRVNPELIVAEVPFCGQSVTDLLGALRQSGCNSRVLVLSSEASETQMRIAMAAGASGYVLKEDDYDELLDALRAVYSGRRSFSDCVESTILKQYAERIAVRFEVAAAPVTAREREVLARIGQGHTNKAIARALRISVKTVEKHRSNLMRKLGLHNTAAVTVYAMRQGLVGPEQPGTGR
ncbi:MAG TPA: response regulator transcription factor [Steroidobacteraceae bacterium]|nr:response regulator transcription factor [Steroidobacteraceae bacterium]